MSARREEGRWDEEKVPHKGWYEVERSDLTNTEIMARLPTAVS